MSFLPLAAAASAGWFVGSYAWDLKRKQSIIAHAPVEDPEREEPYQGAMGHIGQWIGSTSVERGNFKSVRTDHDMKGAKIFLVDYGNGSLVTQYHDPRIKL